MHILRMSRVHYSELSRCESTSGRGVACRGYGPAVVFREGSSILRALLSTIAQDSSRSRLADSQHISSAQKLLYYLSLMLP